MCPAPREPGGITDRVLIGWARWSMTYPVLCLAIVLAVTAAALVPVLRIKLNPDLGALLPEGSASTSKLQRATSRVGGTDLFAVTAEGLNPDLNLRAVDQLASRVATWDECAWVAVERKFDRLEEKALLFIPAANLVEIRGAIQEQIEYETCARSPLCVNLEEKAPPDLKGLFRKAVEASVLSEMGGEDIIESILGEGEAKAGGRFMSKDGKVAAMLARLAEPATNIDFARMIRKRIERIIENMPRALRDKVTVKVRGAYDATREYDITARESTVVSFFSLGLMFFIVLLFFSQKRALAIVLVPLVIGAVLSLAFASVVYRSLNSITAFIVAILLGMGIDYSVHIQRCFTEEALKRDDEAYAMALGLRGIVRPVFVAALTTIAALLTLRFAHFRGFKEYGTIAAFGIAACLLTAVAVIPPLNALFSRVRKVRPPRFMIEDDDGAQAGKDAAPARPVTRAAVAAALMAVIAATIAVAPYALNVSFETDFKKFRAPGVGELEDLERAIGTGRANPMIILGGSEAQMRRLHLQLAAKLKAQEDGRMEKLVSGFLTIASVMPAAAEQRQRLDEIARLETLLQTKVLRHVQGENKEKIDKLRDLASVKTPVGVDDLPFWARNLLREKDGSIGRIGYIYPAIDRWSAKEVRWLRDAYDTLNDGGKKVDVASSSFVFLDIISVVERDARGVGIIASLVIFLILLLDLRSVLGAAVCFSTLGGAVLWTLAVMRLTGINIGVYNLLVLPTLMGTGIDASVYLWHRWRQVGRNRIRYLMGSTGMATVVALLTTAAGFSGLMMSIHPGLRSIAYFALPGFGFVILFSFIFMPAVFFLARKM
jgi:predicted RND superfamily exporter protein